MFRQFYKQMYKEEKVIQTKILFLTVIYTWAKLEPGEKVDNPPIHHLLLYSTGNYVLVGNSLLCEELYIFVVPTSQSWFTIDTGLHFKFQMIWDIVMWEHSLEHL